jgi:hypothetical protein
MMLGAYGSRTTVASSRVRSNFSWACVVAEASDAIANIKKIAFEVVEVFTLLRFLWVSFHESCILIWAFHIDCLVEHKLACASG